MTRQAVLLLVGTLILLLVSGGIILWGIRGAAPPPASSPPPPTTTVAAAAAVESTTTPTVAPTVPPTPTVRPSPTATATTGATPRPATATRAASATPGRPLVANGLCAMALPAGFVEERPGGGYYPATDKTGFAALDQFSTEGGTRSAEELAGRFSTTTLALNLQGLRQTGGEQVAGGYRLDFTASVGGQPGRGSVFVRPFDTVACGATLFLLNRSPLPFATAREVVILSVGTR